MQPADNPDNSGSESADELAGDERGLPPIRDRLPPIPHELEYLVEPGIHYGRRYQFDDAIQWFLENAEESEFDALAALAERVRLSGHFPVFDRWSSDVNDVVDRILDERHPYTVRTISKREKDSLLRLINVANDPPDVAHRRREKGLRAFLEANDDSDAAKRRREASGRLLMEANDAVHHMDIYFLFGLMSACDMEFER